MELCTGGDLFDEIEHLQRVKTIPNYNEHACANILRQVSDSFLSQSTDHHLSLSLSLSLSRSVCLRVRVLLLGVGGDPLHARAPRDPLRPQARQSGVCVAARH